jgi:hypothetical protein
VVLGDDPTHAAGTTIMSKGIVAHTSWNFIQGDGVLSSDHDLFFGPFDPGEGVEILEGDMLDVLVITGVFPSKNIARKNGWGAEQEPTFRWKDRGLMFVVDTPGRSVPNGFTLFRAGKGKATEIAILRMDSAV